MAACTRRSTKSLAALSLGHKGERMSPMIGEVIGREAVRLIDVAHKIIPDRSVMLCPRRFQFRFRA